MPKQASISSRYSRQEIARPPRMLTGRSRRGSRISPATIAATSKPTQAKRASCSASESPSGSRGSLAGDLVPAGEPEAGERDQAERQHLGDREQVADPGAARDAADVDRGEDEREHRDRGRARQGRGERGPERGRVVQHDLRDQRIRREARDREQPADREAGHRPERALARTPAVRRSRRSGSRPRPATARGSRRRRRRRG